MSAEALLRLIEDERQLALELLRLTDEQTGMLERDEMTAFGKSLEKRQETIDGILRARNDISALAASSSLAPASALAPVNALPRAAEDAQEAVLDILRQAQTRNETNEIRLKAMMEKLGEMIGSLDDSKKGLSRYGGQPVPPQSSFDGVF